MKDYYKKFKQKFKIKDNKIFIPQLLQWLKLNFDIQLVDNMLIVSLGNKTLDMVIIEENNYSGALCEIILKMLDVGYIKDIEILEAIDNLI